MRRREVGFSSVASAVGSPQDTGERRPCEDNEVSDEDEDVDARGAASYDMVGWLMVGVFVGWVERVVDALICDCPLCGRAGR